MGWTTPRDWTAGEIVTAAIMNTHVRDDLRYLKGSDGDTALDAGLTVASGIGNTQLKVATGAVTSSLQSGDVAHVSLEDWCFFPNFFNTDSQELRIETSTTSSITTTSRFRLQAPETSTTFVCRYRYLTASGPPDIRVGLDASGNICAVAAAPDPFQEDPITMKRIQQYLQFKPSIQVYRAIASEGEVASRILQSGMIVSGDSLNVGDTILRSN